MKKNMRNLIIFAVILCLIAYLAACWSSSSPANSASTPASSAAKVAFPTREIKIIIPYSVGGGNDTAARIIVPYMEAELGFPIIIDNQAGGAGLVGTNILAVAPKDGYTIGIFTSPSVPDLCFLQNETSWKPSDFVYLGAFNDEPQCIIVNGTSKWQTLQELIDDARTKDYSINVGATGPISISAIVISQLEEATGCRFNFVQFDGTSETITALYGDHIDVAVRPGDRYAAEHEDGQLRLLAVAAEERLPALPDVPTIEEATGAKIVAKSFRGWWAPAGIPPERLEIIRNAFDKAMDNPELQQKITDAVADFSYTPGKELAELMDASIEMWRVELPKLGAWATR